MFHFLYNNGFRAGMLEINILFFVASCLGIYHFWIWGFGIWTLRTAGWQGRIRHDLSSIAPSSQNSIFIYDLYRLDVLLIIHGCAIILF